VNTKRPLITERLRLEPVAREHLDEIVDIHRRNAAHFDTRMARLLDTRRIAERLLDEKPGTERFVVLYPEPRLVIGMVAMSNITSWPFSNASLGYWLDREASGHGFAREAVARVVRYAFAQRKLHRAEASIAPDNTASIRLIEALGFRFEGLSPRMLHLSGDQLRYAITVEEWNGR
jgi:[ribosomal protein S5]-alanine N-acetyltransferase